MKVKIETVRDLQIYKQFGNSQINPKLTMTELLASLGFVQLDTMSVVARSQELFFWSRIKNYQLGDMLELYQQGIGLELYSFALTFHLKNQQVVPLIQKFNHNSLMANPASKESFALLEELREVAPILKRHFVKNQKQGTWSQSKNDQAVDRLWRAGLIDIQRDEKFNKRLHLGGEPDFDLEAKELEYQIYYQLILMTFDNLGIINQEEVSHYFNLKKGLSKEIIIDLLAEQLIEAVEVAEYGEHYLLKSDKKLVNQLVNLQPIPPKLLSPFDNLIRDRERTAKLFGIEFKLESYINPEKRKYGYYAMPILIDGQIIGTVDLKNERQLGILNIKQFFFFKQGDQQKYQIEILKLLTDLKVFLGLEELMFQGEIFNGL